MFIVGMIAGTLVWYLAKDSTFNDWKDMLIWMTGIYMSGNGVEYAAKCLKKDDSTDDVG